MKTKKQTRVFAYATDSTSGFMGAKSLRDAFIKLRREITPEMVANGATLWVEDFSGKRMEMK